MNLTRAFTVVLALATGSLLAAIFTVGFAIRLGDLDVEQHAHGALQVVAKRIAANFADEVLPLNTHLSFPLSPAALDRYGQRIVIATIGEDDGVDGGFYLPHLGVVADGPIRLRTRRDREAVATLARRTGSSAQTASLSVTLPNGDVVVFDAAALGHGRGIAWARESIPASFMHGSQWLVGLTIVAAACCLTLVIAGALTIEIIRRDARLVLDAIAALELDPTSSPPLPRGEFGDIARAVASMAEHRAKAEQLAAESMRLASLGRLTANAAHEIRNPLNALRLQVSVLSKRLGPLVEPQAQKLVSEIGRLNRVVTGMLAIGTEPTASRESFDLVEIVVAAIRVLDVEASDRRCRIDFECQSSGAGMFGDRDRVLQLVLNLLSNAIDASPSGALVEITIESGPRLRVTDYGSGIPSDDLSRVFEPFYTTKPHGNGLGLAIVYEIAAAHRAAIDVSSRPGCTSFVVDFTAAQEDEKQATFAHR